MANPKGLFANWDEAAARLSGARRLALLTDFDGTLARIQRRPEQVRLPRRARAALAHLLRQGALVGVISGRRLADIRARVGLRQLWYAGSHGLALAPPRGRPALLVSGGTRRRMRSLQRALRRSLAPLKGIMLEQKDSAFAVHYRNAAYRDRVRAHRLVALAVADAPRVLLRPGKLVWDVLPDAGHSKGTAVWSILARENAGRGDALVFIGDDLADEHVFAQVRKRSRAITVVVGRRRDSCAEYCVRSVRDVHAALERLVETIR